MSELRDANSSVPCANGCGYWGNALTGNMCSKCYRELQHPEGEPISKQFNDKTETTRELADVCGQLIKEKDSNLLPQVGGVDVQQKTVAVETPVVIEQSEPKVDVTKCYFCKRRVGLIGFKCRCNFTYCSRHRYSDKHSCTYDYRAAARVELAKNNPVVKAAKIAKI